MTVRERDVQRLVLDWLAAKRIWHIRLNTGAMSGSHKGKRWFVKFGVPGMSDVLIWHNLKAVWCEVKSPTGKLSGAQEAFKKEVTEQGMKYIVVRDLDDLVKAMGER